MLMLLVTNSEEWCRRDVNEQRRKAEGLVRDYQRLLNVEFDWDPDYLSYQPPVEGPSIPITIDMVKKAISQIKAGKAPRPFRHSGGDDMSASMIRDPAVAIILDGKVPSDWEQSLSASARERGMHWKGATTAVSSWLSRWWKSWRGLWLASSDNWCQSTIPRLASSQAEAQLMQSFLSSSCKRSV